MVVVLCTDDDRRGAIGAAAASVRTWSARAMKCGGAIRCSRRGRRRRRRRRQWRPPWALVLDVEDVAGSCYVLGPRWLATRTISSTARWFRDPGGSRVRLLDIEDGGRGSSTWAHLLRVPTQQSTKDANDQRRTTSGTRWGRPNNQLIRRRRGSCRLPATAMKMMARPMVLFGRRLGS